MNELFLGFYFGTICTVLLYNLQWYIISKEKGYLFYVLTHISILCFFLNAHSFFQISNTLLLTCSIVFAILFSKEFLNLKKFYPKFDTFLTKFLMVYILFMIVIYLSNLDYLLFYIPQFSIFIPFIVLGFVLYKNGFTLALYFILGWGIFTAAVLTAFVIKHIHPDLVINEYIIVIGSLLEAIILSFALSKKTKTLLEEKNQQEKILVHQSRLASMGEMLANISHQWRQPLNRIASFIMNMQLHIYEHYKNETYLLEKLEESQMQLEYMSHTIDDFSDFYKKDRKKENFAVSAPINNAIKIISSSLHSNNITLDLHMKEDFNLTSYPKELAQVILNLLQNSKDQIIIRNIKEGSIILMVGHNFISIEDNAGGIQSDIINRICEPYFTTKEKHKGTGLGLYMSTIILENHFQAQLNIENTKKGAKFSIVFG